jgi:UPF0716 protein FxsA
MGWFLAVALLVVPFLEVGLLIQTRWPAWVLVLWCAATAAIGAYFARGEDWTLWTELESDVQNGRVPTAEGLDAMLKLIGAWGLIVPGLITDALGAALLVPPLRRAGVALIRSALRDWLSRSGQG